MAQKAQIDILINAAQSATTLREMNDALSQINAELENVDVNSDAFLDLSKAAEMADLNIKKVNGELDQMNFEKTKNGVESFAKAISGSMGLATGVMATFGAESEKTQEVLAKVGGVLAFSQGINDMIESFDKAKKSNDGLVKSLLTNPFIMLAAVLLPLIAQTEAFQEIFAEFQPIIDQLTQALKPLLDSLMMLLKDLLKALVPILKIFAEILAAVLVPIIETLASVFELLAEPLKMFGNFIKENEELVKVFTGVLLLALGPVGLLAGAFTLLGDETEKTTGKQKLNKETVDFLTAAYEKLNKTNSRTIEQFDLRIKQMQAEGKSEKEIQNALVKRNQLENKLLQTQLEKLKLIPTLYKLEGENLEKYNDMVYDIEKRIQENNIATTEIVTENLNKEKAKREETAQINTDLQEQLNKLKIENIEDEEKRLEAQFLYEQDLLKKSFQNNKNGANLTATEMEILRQNEIKFNAEKAKRIDEQNKKSFELEKQLGIENQRFNINLIEDEKERKRQSFEFEKSLLEESLLNNENYFIDATGKRIELTEQEKEQLKNLEVEYNNWLAEYNKNQNQKSIDAKLQYNVISAKTDKERLAAELKVLEQEKQKVLENTELTAEERDLLLEQLNQQTLDKQTEFNQNLFDKINEQATQFKDILFSVMDGVLAFMQQQTEKEIQNNNEVFENRKTLLEAQNKQGILSEREYNRELEKLEKEQQKKEAEIKRKAFEADKNAKFIQSIINGALAISVAVASAPFPFNIPAIAQATITTGIQTALIASQPTPKFARGGLVTGNDGGTQDSIPALLSSGESVINAAATKQFMPVLSAINQSTGGAQIGNSSGGLMDINTLTNAIINAMQAANIKAYITDKELLTSLQNINLNNLNSTF